MKFLRKPFFLIITIVVVATSILLVFVFSNISNDDSNKPIQVENTTEDQTIVEVETDTDDPSEEDTEENDESDEESTTIQDDYYEYTVKEGDSLYSITINEMPWASYSNALKMITELNNIIETDPLYSGKTLLIPTNTIDTTNCIPYTVKQDDTLYRIAIDFYPNIDPQESVKSIMDKNNIYDPLELSSGRELYLPDVTQVLSATTTDAE